MFEALLLFGVFRFVKKILNVNDIYIEFLIFRSTAIYIFTYKKCTNMTKHISNSSGKFIKRSKHSMVLAKDRKKEYHI